MVVVASHPEQESVPPNGADLLREGISDAPGRRALREQVTRLERDLAETLVAVFPYTAITAHDTRVEAPARGPRLLTLGELEQLRDDLAIQLREARVRLAERSEDQQAARELLEAMLLAPGEHKFARVTNRRLGEGGCGAYQVRPRLGLIGMLAGWWHVKLSSGCPLR